MCLVILEPGSNHLDSLASRQRPDLCSLRNLGFERVWFPQLPERSLCDMRGWQCGASAWVFWGWLYPSICAPGQCNIVVAWLAVTRQTTTAPSSLSSHGVGSIIWRTRKECVAVAVAVKRREVWLERNCNLFNTGGAWICRHLWKRDLSSSRGNWHLWLDASFLGWV